MQLFEGYSADELHRVLSVSRWIAGLLFLLAIALAILNHWLFSRIISQQQVERDAGRSRLIAAEEELRRLRSQMSSVTSVVDKLTASRKLSAKQITELKSALATAAKGPLLITYLTIEWEAEDYAKHLGKILTEAGYSVSVSDHLWVKLEHNGLYLTSKDGSLPAHGESLKLAFAAIGIDLPVHPPGQISTEIAIPPGATVLVVGHQ